MIVFLKHDSDCDQLAGLISWLQDKGVTVHSSLNESHTVLGLEGDTSHIDIDVISALDIVEDVKRVQEPHKNASRRSHPEDTVISVGNTQIGGGTLTIMAGPCSVESEEQVVSIAKAVKASGATMLRGGAFKARTSPYSFQGLGATGLEILKVAKQETGLPIVTELMDPSQLPLFKDRKSDRLPDDFWIHHITSVFIETAVWWIGSGMKESPETITEYFLLAV
jgi:3-deoxy-7-phosphoheptulonate synthase